MPAASTSDRSAIKSEIQGKIPIPVWALFGCGLLRYWKGVNPDHVADMFHNYKYWEIIYEDIWM